MATLLTIPARNDLPWYKFKIALSGVQYTLHFRFNSRMNRWILDIRDASDNPIILGLPVLINRDMAGQYITFAIPPGIIYATDDTQTDTQPTQFSFGVDHTLWYGTA
jgi:hypothetical protein